MYNLVKTSSHIHVWYLWITIFANVDGIHFHVQHSIANLVAYYIVILSRSLYHIMDVKVQISLWMASIEYIVWYLCNEHGTTKMVLGDVENFSFCQKCNFISNQLFYFKSHKKSGDSDVCYLDNELSQSLILTLPLYLQCI